MARSNEPFQHVAVFGWLSCLTSLLENFSFDCSRGLRGVWTDNEAGRLSGLYNEKATKMLSQIPLEVLEPQLCTVACRPVYYSQTLEAEFDCSLHVSRVFWSDCSRGGKAKSLQGITRKGDELPTRYPSYFKLNSERKNGERKANLWKTITSNSNLIIRGYFTAFVGFWTRSSIFKIYFTNRFDRFIKSVLEKFKTCFSFN